MKTSFALILVAALAVTVSASRENLVITEDSLTHQGRTPFSLLWLLRNRVGTGSGVATAAAVATCPPPGYDSVEPFDVARYIEAPWYTQAQINTTFQPRETLYCVRAQYTALDPKNPLAGVLVRNYANRGAVNGPIEGTSGPGSNIPLRFIGVPEADEPSKVTVGFALPNSNNPLAFGGPNYWVVALDPDYQWAIITGGAPGQLTENNKCTTSGGFYLFTRDPVVPQSTIDAMKAKADELGLDTAQLVTVPQAGCKYEGA